jgi:peptide/nickel transport system substrate-binding protein
MARSVNRTVNLARIVGLAVGVCVAGSVVVACSSSGGGTSSNGGKTGATTGAPSEAVSNSSAAKFVNGGTFNFALNSDPGNLDPQASAASNLYQMSFLSYDSLLSISSAGKIQSQLATSWKEQGKTITLTLHKGITCSDGTPFTAKTAADNVNYVADPKNKSPFGGVFIAAGAKATGNTSTNTVTITLPAPAPFALNGLAGVPMVCAKGLADRKLLATKTDGTGPFTLTESASNDHYTLAKRSGYTWGPNGASTSTVGMPDKIVIKIVPNETTATNLLLSGQLNATTVVGPDTQRLEAQKLYSVGTPSVIGEMWYNQAPGRLTADQKVRSALSQAVDFGQLQKVLTSGRGEPGTTFAAIPPVACPGNSVAKALPTHDLDKAKSLLDSDGWKVGAGGIRAKGGKQLALSFLYNTQSGSAGSAAAELAAQEWHQLGVKVTLKAQDETAATNTLFSSGNWDIVWEPLNVSSPDQLVGFMSGAAPPSGENFAHIKNSAYDQAVAKAQQTQGTAGCPQWLSAESSLVSNADVIPFANQVQQTFGKGAQFQVLGVLQPTSIRMTG